MKSYYRPLTELLKEHGFEIFRQGKGSHQIWKHFATGRQVTVSTNCYTRHTANAILKQAEIDAKI